MIKVEASDLDELYKLLRGNRTFQLPASDAHAAFEQGDFTKALKHLSDIEEKLLSSMNLVVTRDVTKQATEGLQSKGIKNPTKPQLAKEIAKFQAQHEKAQQIIDKFTVVISGLRQMVERGSLGASHDMKARPAENQVSLATVIDLNNSMNGDISLAQAILQKEALMFSEQGLPRHELPQECRTLLIDAVDPAQTKSILGQYFYKLDVAQHDLIRPGALYQVEQPDGAVRVIRICGDQRIGETVNVENAITGKPYNTPLSVDAIFKSGVKGKIKILVPANNSPGSDDSIISAVQE